MMRNIDEASKEAQKLASAPLHMQKPTQVENIYEMGTKNRIIDPYDWLRTSYSEDDEGMFVEKEAEFANLMLIKYDYLTKLIWREQDLIFGPQILNSTLARSVFAPKTICDQYLFDRSITK